MIHVRAHPTLVLLAGLPATGRSTVAIALARRLGWPAIDKDLLTVGSHLSSSVRARSHRRQEVS